MTSKISRKTKTVKQKTRNNESTKQIGFAI